VIIDEGHNLLDTLSALHTVELYAPQVSRAIFLSSS
jgi:pyrroloquinoline quinone (PQQ) biosynthesis protein C